MTMAALHVTLYYRSLCSERELLVDRSSILSITSSKAETTFLWKSQVWDYLIKTVLEDQKQI